MLYSYQASFWFNVGLYRVDYMIKWVFIYQRCHWKGLQRLCRVQSALITFFESLRSVSWSHRSSSIWKWWYVFVLIHSIFNREGFQFCLKVSKCFSRWHFIYSFNFIPKLFYGSVFNKQLSDFCWTVISKTQTLFVLIFLFCQNPIWAVFPLSILDW